MKPLLQITTVPAAGALRVVAEGELDLSTAKSLEEVLRAAEVTDTPTIILDIEAVSFIDSTGLRVLLDAVSRSQATNRRLRLTSGTDQARRLFALTGVTHQLPFIEDPRAGRPRGVARPSG